MPASPLFDATSISRIERALGLTLPAAYTQILLAYPFERDSEPYWWELFGSAERIIEVNQEHREDGFFDQSWPATYLIIGGDGAGNLYFLDLLRQDSPVFFADHERTARRDALAISEVAPNVAAWVEHVRAEEAAFEAEEQARAERRQHKKWWQFWT